MPGKLETKENLENKPTAFATMDKYNYRNIVRNIPGILAIVNKIDLKIVFANKQFENTLGYLNEDIIKQNLLITDLISINQKERLLHNLENIEDNKSGIEFNIFKVKSKNNKKNNYFFYVSKLDNYGNENEISYIFILHPDNSTFTTPFISFDTRELFIQQYKNEDFGTFECNIHEAFFVWTEGMFSIYEVDKEYKELTIEFMLSFIHPTYKEIVSREIYNAIENRLELNIEYKIITKKNNVKLIKCILKSVINDIGIPVKLIGSIRDLTNHSLIEENLKNKVEELHSSNKELEDFAYIASHDLQEPLRKITTFSGRLSEKYKDVLQGEGLMYLNRMTASAENMRSLINNLLDFSRISKTMHVFEPVDLNIILKNVKMDLELLIDETKTVIENQNLPIIDAISSQMKQLFTNLLSNAIKFRKTDLVPCIKIEITNISDQEIINRGLSLGIKYFKIQITDNGIGFEPDSAVKIFQVFHRLHGKSEYPGSGVGLAICKKIIENHHGVIYAENIDTVGSKFQFILPETQQNFKYNY